MSTLHQTRCLNHPAREAAARCPVCRNFFCRECVTEHDGRFVCAACIQRCGGDDAPAKASGRLRRGMGYIGFSLRVAVGLVLLWLLFHTIGRVLLTIPDSFHAGEWWGTR